MHFPSPFSYKTDHRRVVVAALGYASLVAASVTLVTLAQLLPVGRGGGIKGGIVERPSRNIPTCVDLGRCPDEEHLILSTTHPRVLDRIKGRGCRIRHRLKDSTVLRCPLGVAFYQARPERIFKIQGWISSNQVRAITVQQTGVSGAGVKVAVLDTGIDTTHPELQDRVISRTSFTDSDGFDRQGHGTHVAGIIVGQGMREVIDNGETNSARGVSPGASLLVGQICDEQGFCSEGDIMKGIEWAVEQEADVINLSLGAGVYLDHCDTDPLAAKVNWAVDQGVSVVAGAGNGGEYGEGVLAPACASKAIAVGAVDRSDVRPVWSSYGKAIDMVAPGVGVLSIYPCAVAGTCPEAAYWKGYGTSMATPHVAGAVALLKEEFPTLTPGDLYAALTLSAYDLRSSGFDIETGYGRLDSEAARNLVRSGWLPPSHNIQEPMPSDPSSTAPPSAPEPSPPPSVSPSEEPTASPPPIPESPSQTPSPETPPSEPSPEDTRRDTGVDAEADSEVEVEVDTGQGVRGRGEAEIDVEVEVRTPPFEDNEHFDPGSGAQDKGQGKGMPETIREFLRSLFESKSAGRGRR